MPRYDICAYKRGSTAARRIAEDLPPCRRFNVDKLCQLSDKLGRCNKTYMRTVINWGSSDTRLSNYRVINKPSAVAIATNKLKTFEVLRLAGVPIPMYFTSRVERYPEIIYARHLTRGNSGRGITVVQPGENVPYAPLYTVGIQCKREYRVHVFDGVVIDLVAKCKRNGDTEVGDYIRNHACGYIFTRESVTIPDSVRSDLHSLAISAISALGLDFGAVDIIRGMNNQMYVLEINTAPGLDGTTLEAYINAFQNHEE